MTLYQVLREETSLNLTYISEQVYLKIWTVVSDPKPCSLSRWTRSIRIWPNSASEGNGVQHETAKLCITDLLLIMNVSLFKNFQCFIESF